MRESASGVRSLDTDSVPGVRGITRMRLLRIPEPFDHPDWLFEPKMDGFRGLAHVKGHHCTLRGDAADRLSVMPVRISYTQDGRADAWQRDWPARPLTQERFAANG
jgi:hypothetical protein